jgi:hypothetical protein
MKLGQFRTIEEPDLPACWLFWNTRVKGYVGEVDLPTDQYILRPVEHIFQEACNMVRHLPDGPPLLGDWVQMETHAHVVEAREIDDYGSMQFKWEYWGVPER